MENSKNQGFAVLDRETLTCEVRFLGETFKWTRGEESRLPEGLRRLIEAVCGRYAYLLR